MKSFDVYHSSAKGLRLIKSGFSWPAFFLNFIWLFYAGLWDFAIAFLCWILFGAYLLVAVEPVQENIYLLASLCGVYFIIILLPGLYGNRWLKNKLVLDRFELVQAIQAKSRKDAYSRLQSLNPDLYARHQLFRYAQQENDDTDSPRIGRSITVHRVSSGFSHRRKILVGFSILLSLTLSWTIVQHESSTQKNPVADESLKEKPLSQEEADHVHQPENKEYSAEKITSLSKEAKQLQDEDLQMDSEVFSKEMDTAHTDSDSAQKIAEQCRKESHVGQWEEAVELCRQSVSENPQDAGSWEQLGRSYMHTDQPGEAAKAFEKAGNIDASKGLDGFELLAEKEPDKAQAWVGMGRAYMEMDDTDQALQAFDKAAALDPEKGREGLEKVVQEKPENARAWKGLGRSYLETEQPEQAVLAFEKASQSDMQLGMAELQAVVRKYPNNASALKKLGSIYRKAGRTEMAVDHLEDAVNKNSGSASAWFELGKALHELSQATSTDSHSGPQVVTFYHELLDVWQVFEGFRVCSLHLEAMQAYQHAVLLHPGYAIAWRELGSFFLQQGGWTKPAVFYLKNAVKANPMDVDAWEALNVAYRASGQKSRASYALHRAGHLSSQ
ncbi:Protein of unknown function DUF2506 [Desulfonatronospira thiodismutans ASO3-1]|uniref:Uncharacterized protein n=1 Tax=Desulfonatronospira thiodismutans ASO3-1 TaxID=555779 RepID=D6STU3_9BACT|nr:MULTISPECIES: tetratricopeptide repeat protein [Desulfonatronospira]EFI34109.1 Protein of unknown function DUF2506 [Desulfonatronospira thiodismutans ASO3-1]